MIPLPQLGFLRGVFLANHLASNDSLTRMKTRICAAEMAVQYAALSA